MVSDPSRRAFLAGLAVGLAGCAGNPTTPEPAGQTDSPKKTSPKKTATERHPTSQLPSETTEAGSSAPTTSSTPQSAQWPDEITQLPAEEPELTWAIHLPGPIAGSPAVSDSRGHVYVGTGTTGSGTPVGDDSNPDGELFALQRSDGSVAWREDTSGPVADQPVVHDGRVHVVTGRSTGFTGIAQRIDAYGQDGTRHWTTEPQDNYLSIVATHDGAVFAGTSDDQLSVKGETVFAVDSNGDVRWEQEAGDAMGGTFADGVVLYNAGFGAVAAYDPADGATTWQVAGDPIQTRHSNITVIDGLCFRQPGWDSSGEGALIAHSIADGTEQWRYADAPGVDGNFVPTGVMAVPEDAGTNRVDADFVGTEHSGVVFALTDDGTEQWTFQTDTDRTTSAAVGDAVYVSDIEGTVYALSLSDGHELWRVSLPNSASLMSVSNGFVGYCRMEDEQTIASVAADGTERWSYTTSKELTMPVVTDDRIYACAADGTILAFIIDTE